MTCHRTVSFSVCRRNGAMRNSNPTSHTPATTSSTTTTAAKPSSAATASAAAAVDSKSAAITVTTGDGELEESKYKVTIDEFHKPDDYFRIEKWIGDIETVSFQTSMLPLTHAEGRLICQ